MKAPEDEDDEEGGILGWLARSAGAQILKSRDVTRDLLNCNLHCKLHFLP